VLKPLWLRIWWTASSRRRSWTASPSCGPRWTGRSAITTSHNSRRFGPRWRKSLRLEAVHQIRSHRGSSTARARRRRPYEFARSRQIGRICRVVLLCVFGTLDKVFDALPDRRVTRVPFVPSTACKNPTRPPAGQSKTPVMIYRLFRFAPLALPCWLHRLGQQGAQHSRHQQGQHRGRQGQQHAHSFIQ